MKKILSVLVCVCLLVSAMVFTTAAAEPTVVTYTTSDYSNPSNTGVKNASKTFNDGILTFSAYEGGTSGSVAFRSDEIRLYQGAYATLSATKDITSVTFNIKAKSAIAIDVSTSTDGSSWTVVKSGVSLTTSFADQTINFDPATKYIKISNTTKQVIIKSITVTYAAEGGETGGEEPTCEHTAKSAVPNGDETHKLVCDACSETVTATVDCTDADVNGKCDVCGGDVAIPVQDPAADSTLTIADAIALGASKDHNVYTAGKYYVTGVITEVYQTTYGNMKLTDGDGNILTVYGTYSADGETRYGDLEVKPVAGDTVTVYGIIGQYNGTPQVKNGWITAHTPATTPDGGDDNTGDDNTGDDNTGDAPAANLAVVDSVVAGKAYKFGMVQANLADGNVYYLAGGMDRYYMATTTDVAAAIDVFVEETTGGYYLYTMVDGAKTYINMVVSADGAHVNGAYEAVASTVYTFDATSKTFVATVNDELYWFATRNDNTYTTLGPAKVSYEGFYGQFYAEPVVDDNTGDDNTGDDNTTDDNEGESTVKPEVKPEGDKNTTSPATGDNMGAVVALAMIAGAAVVFANKKR